MVKKTLLYGIYTPITRIGLLVASASLILAGCGPGSPIQTADQAAFYKKVDNLVKENRKLKDRISSLEKNSANKKELAGLEKRLTKRLDDRLRGVNIEALRKDTEEAKKRLASLDRELKTLRADTNATIEGLRQDLAKLQGGVEEADFKADQLRDELKGDISMLNDSLSSLEQRLKGLEERTAELKSGVDSLKVSIDTLEQEGPRVNESIDMVRQDVASLAKGLEELDSRISSVDEKTIELDDRAVVLNDKILSLEEQIRSLEKRIAKAATGKTTTGEETAAGEPDPGVLYMEGFRLITKDHKYKKGIETLERFISLFPKHDLADNARYWIGEGYYGMGDYERAVLEFDKVIKDYPKGDKVAAAMLKQGYSFEKLDALKEAKVLFERVIEKFPGTNEAVKAEKRLDALLKKLSP